MAVFLNAAIPSSATFISEAIKQSETTCGKYQGLSKRGF